MAKPKTAFFCQNCGHQTPKWQGKCPSCKEWNSITEEVQKTQNAKTVIKLKSGDRVVSAFCSPGKTDLGISTSDGQFLRIPVSTVSIQGRGAAGIAGMKLKNGSVVVSADTILGDDFLTTVLNNQTAKVTPLSEFESRGRNGVGVRVTKVPEDSKVTVAKIGPLTNLLAVMATDEDPKKADPNPVTFLLEPSNRDLVSTKTERQILTLGISRWLNSYDYISKNKK